MLQPEDSSGMVCDNIALWSKKSQGKIRKIVWTWLGETPSEVILSKWNTQLHIANQPVHVRDSVPCTPKIYQLTCVKYDTCTSCIFLGYEYYKELRKQALKAVLIPHTTLYLDVSPETCNQRILGRGRVQYHNWLIAVIRNICIRTVLPGLSLSWQIQQRQQENDIIQELMNFIHSPLQSQWISLATAGPETSCSQLTQDLSFIAKVF